MKAQPIDILCVSWRSPEFLRCLVKSIRRNSTVDHRIHVHFNEICNGDSEVATELELDTAMGSMDNIGLAKAVNGLASNVEGEFVLLIDNDMYLLPGWDEALWEFMDEYNIDPLSPSYILCPTMIEPTGAHNLVIAPVDLGRTPADFKEDLLLDTYDSLAAIDTTPRFTDLGPFFMRSSLFDKVGGYNESFGVIGTDNYLCAKAFYNGARIIVKVPSSLVYHFQCVSTSKMTTRDRIAAKLHRDETFEQEFGSPLKIWQRERLCKGEEFKVIKIK